MEEYIKNNWKDITLILFIIQAVLSEVLSLIPADKVKASGTIQLFLNLINKVLGKK